jgi:DNA-directed RNA polymerase specialized sigma24 family protein
MPQLLGPQHDQFLRLYAEHEVALHTFVRSMLTTREDASEVMQEAIILILWRKDTHGKYIVPISPFHRTTCRPMSAESHAIQQAAAEFIRDRHLLGAFVTGLLRDVHAVEDVLQEVWVRLAAEMEKGVSIQNQAAWCRGVARNLIRRHWEKQQMAKVVADSEALDAFMDRVEQCFAWADTQEHFATARLAALDECVGSLPERSRRSRPSPHGSEGERGSGDRRLMVQIDVVAKKSRALFGTRLLW